jgi:hypothetical protein
VVGLLESADIYDVTSNRIESPLFCTNERKKETDPLTEKCVFYKPG